MKFILKKTTQLFTEVIDVYWTLVKIMVPTILIVKVLELFGAIKFLSIVLNPIMMAVGLPPEMGIVWATSLTSGIYAAMAIYFEVSNSAGLSVAQISVLGTMILIGHAIPMEGAIAKKAGVRWRSTLLVRMGGAIVLGAVLNVIYSSLNVLQQPATLIWQPDFGDTSWLGWCISQAKVFASMFVTIFVLIFFLKVLRKIGVEKLMHIMLDPVLKMLGMSRATANTTVIGMTLGISLGGGLLIQEAKRGHMSKKEILLSLSLLGLCHSMIEDMLLIALLGADLSAILWARLLFALIVVALLSKAIDFDRTEKLLGYALNKPARP